MTTDIWQSLIGELTVTGGHASSCDGRDLGELERELGFKFPRGYKEFCNVFGSGELAGFIRIYCFCFRSGQQGILDLTRLLQNQLGLLALKSELRSEMNRLRKGHPGADPEKLTLLQRVLSEAFIFGDDPNAQTYLWDLGSYDESDQSCDIYLVPTDDLDRTTKLGRDFFEFVNDFCLGSRARKVLPPSFRFYEEFTGKHFLRFSRESLLRT